MDRSQTSMPPSISPCPTSPDPASPGATSRYTIAPEPEYEVVYEPYRSGGHRLNTNSGAGVHPIAAYTTFASGQYNQGGWAQGRRTPRWRLVGAAVAAVAVVVGAVVLAVSLGSPKPPPAEASKGPEQVVQQFFTAVDNRDDKAMRTFARGDLLQDIDDIMKVSKSELPVTFGDGKASEVERKKVDGVELATLKWTLKASPPGMEPGEGTLVVMLLDSGNGFEACKIDSESTNQDAMSEFVDQYETLCSYSK